MTKLLDPEIKRLRGLSPAQLADEVGTLKAAIAAVDEKLERVKAEGVRRGLVVFDSDLFHCTLSPPTDSRRVDKQMLGQVFGAAFIEHFSKDVAGCNWTLRCSGRPT